MNEHFFASIDKIVHFLAELVDFVQSEGAEVVIVAVVGVGVVYGKECGVWHSGSAV